MFGLLSSGEFILGCRRCVELTLHSDIMRDNMIICLSGLGPGHCMPMDMNIEHLIGYLKVSVFSPRRC
jgi:hypothetical protein